MSNFFKFSFWFDVYPLTFTTAILWGLLGLCLAAVIISIIVRYYKSKKLTLSRLAGKALSKFCNWLLSFGLVGLLLTFFKQQRAPYLGMRVWLLLWAVAWLIWLAFIIKYVLITIPKIKKETEKKQEFEKYLP